MSSEPFNRFIGTYQARIEARLNALFDNIPSHSTSLIAAMRYSLLGGGKRIRPLLAYAAAEACGTSSKATDDFAAAVECIHAYSLIHDDLPAMDDDDLRRGKPTSHIAFNEATAILAGDALQCLAFQTLADSNHASADCVVRALGELSRAAGVHGMVIGQAIDLEAVDSSPSIENLQTMHFHKTGALIEASTVLGALSTQAGDEQIQALRQFARAIGLAFQIQDDIIDVTSDTQTLGKAQGKDAENNKPTYVSLLGLEQARAKAQALKDEAIAALAPLAGKAEILERLANFIVDRQH
jgi:farnesyl diphosphate synthase/geranylgeranyl diphosphate synthase type II